MIVIKVQYTVSEAFAKTNRANIERVMRDLREIGNPRVQYSAFVREDGRSFMHFARYPDRETLKVVTDLPTFQDFQAQLKQSEPITPPVVEEFDLVASTFLEEDS